MKNRCKYRDHAGYCRHKENQERGRGNMKCVENGCPHLDYGNIGTKVQKQNI